MLYTYIYVHNSHTRVYKHVHPFTHSRERERALPLETHKHTLLHAAICKRVTRIHTGNNRRGDRKIEKEEEKLKGKKKRKSNVRAFCYIHKNVAERVL